MQQENCHDSVSFLNLETSRRDKYSPHFCSKEFYLNHQKEFQFIQQFSKNCSQSVQVILWTITLSCLRRKHNWYAGRTQRGHFNDSLKTTTTTDFSLSIYDLFSKLGISWPAKIDKNITLIEFLFSIQIKPLPEAALSGLYHFSTGHYPLIILDYEPDAFEVLTLQTKNKRVITFMADFMKWPELMYGKRDPLSFWLHDFTHAEHFFSDFNKRRAQVGFYKFVQTILHAKILDELLLSPQFLSEFSYLISDMNSHPIHLAQTLRAHIEHQKSAPNTWSLIVEHVCTSFGQKQKAISNFGLIHGALSKVNSRLFSNTDAQVLTDFFIHF